MRGKTPDARGFRQVVERWKQGDEGSREDFNKMKLLGEPIL